MLLKTNISNFPSHGADIEQARDRKGSRVCRSPEAKSANEQA